jgi:3-oxoacyl-(acyl-carrier-protein) synthase
MRERQASDEQAMSKRRVVISGIGAITPIGLTRDGLWEGLRAERSAVGALTRFDPSIFRSHNAAEVRDFTPSDHLESKRAKRLDRFGQFSVIAARMALDDARLDLAREDRERIGAMMATPRSSSRSSCARGCAPSTPPSPSPSSAAPPAATSPSSSACRGPTARTR